MDLEAMTEAQLWTASGVEEGQERGRILRELSDRLFKRRAYEESAATCESAANVFQAEGLLLDEGWSRFGLAAALWHLERWDASAKSYLAAAALFRLAGSDQDVALAMTDAADAFHEAGQVEAALEHWQASVELYHSADDDEAAAKSQLHRAQALAAQQRPDEAVDAFRHARDLAVSAGEPSIVARADERLAICLAEIEQHDEALAALESAIQVVEMLKHPARSAYLHFILAKTLYHAGRYEAALAELTIAHQVAEVAKNYDVTARCELYFSYCLDKLGRVDEALVSATRAVHLLDAVGRRADMHLAQGSMALRHAKLGDHHRAEELLRLSMAGLEAEGEHNLALDASTQLAATLIDLDRPLEALAQLDAKPDLRPVTVGSRGQALYLFIKARVLRAAGDLTQATELLRNIVDLVEGTRHKLDLARALSLLSRMEQEAGGPVDEWTRIRAISLFLALGNAQHATELSELFLTPEYVEQRAGSRSVPTKVAGQRDSAEQPVQASSRVGSPPSN